MLKLKIASKSGELFVNCFDVLNTYYIGVNTLGIVEVAQNLDPEDDLIKITGYTKSHVAVTAYAGVSKMKQTWYFETNTPDNLIQYLVRQLNVAPLDGCNMSYEMF